MSARVSSDSFLSTGGGDLTMLDLLLTAGGKATSSGIMKCKSGGSSTSSVRSVSWEMDLSVELGERNILKKFCKEGFGFPIMMYEDWIKK